MSIRSDGNVGIEKTNPAYKLDATGDINLTGSLRRNGVIVEADWTQASSTSEEYIRNKPSSFPPSWQHTHM